jgi:hypothetical protein
MGDRRLVSGGARLLAAALFVVVVCGTSAAFASAGEKRPAPVRAGVGIATAGVAWNIPGTYWELASMAATRTGDLSVDLATDYFEDDVYAVYLAAGEVVTLELDADAGTDFGMWLFGPDALDVTMDVPVLNADPGAWNGSGMSQKVMPSYYVPKSGWYYVDIFSFIDTPDNGGANSGSGGYAVGIHVDCATTGIVLDAVSTLPYGGRAVIAGQVLSPRTAGPVDGVVTLMASEDGVYYDPMWVMDTTNGSFSFRTPSITRKMFYYVQYAGTTQYNASARPITVNMLALISGPTGSRYGTRSYTLKGSLGSWHLNGSSAVRIYLWRSVSGHWKAYGYRTAKMSGYGLWSPYSVKYKFPYAGKWRMQAYHSDASHATTRSSYTYLTVK